MKRKITTVNVMNASELSKYVDYRKTGHSGMWWSLPGWRWTDEQRRAIASKKVGAQRERTLLRHFSPLCVGKHDRTSHDIMHCDDCAQYTVQCLMAEGEARRAKKRKGAK